jgi:hypothetical protein
VALFLLLPLYSRWHYSYCCHYSKGGFIPAIAPVLWHDSCDKTYCTVPTTVQLSSCRQREFSPHPSREALLRNGHRGKGNHGKGRRTTDAAGRAVSRRKYSRVQTKVKPVPEHLETSFVTTLRPLGTCTLFIKELLGLQKLFWCLAWLSIEGGML